MRYYQLCSLCYLGKGNFLLETHIKKANRKTKDTLGDDDRKDIQKKMYQTGRPLAKIEEDGKSWLRRPKLYKGVVEPYKKKFMLSH